MPEHPANSIVRSLPIGWPLHNPHGLVIVPIRGTTSKAVRFRIEDVLGRRINLHVDQSGKWADIRVEVDSK